MEGYISEIRLFAANFAPRSWAFCQGQLMPIAQNTALFSLLGTTFGGNGQTTFGLPDFRSRVAVGTGQGPGLSNVVLGEMAGVESVSLNINQMPAHSHIVGCTTTVGNQSTPAGNIPAAETASAADVYSNAAPNAAMNPAMIPPSGSNQPHENRQPYLGMNYIICLEGIYPSRN